MLEAYRPGRVEQLLALLDPGIEWVGTRDWIEQEVWYGHAGVRAGLERFLSEWDDFRHDLEEFRDGGDRFAVITRMHGTARHTGIHTERRTAGVCEVRDGLIVRIVGYDDPEAALAAIG